MSGYRGPIATLALAFIAFVSALLVGPFSHAAGTALTCAVPVLYLLSWGWTFRTALGASPPLAPHIACVWMFAVLPTAVLAVVWRHAVYENDSAGLIVVVLIWPVLFVWLLCLATTLVMLWKSRRSRKASADGGRRPMSDDRLA